MYGRAGAMRGNYLVLGVKIWRKSSMDRLIASAAISLFLHLLFIFLPMSSGPVGFIDGQGAEPLLQVTLLQSFPPRGVDRSANKRGGSEGAGFKRAPQPSSGGGPMVPVLKDASIVSEISIVIDNPSASGFLILSLDVNADGVVDASEIVYSELPADVTQLIERKFATAKFKPAAVNGEPRRSRVLFRVDVD